MLTRCGGCGVGQSSECNGIIPIIVVAYLYLCLRIDSLRTADTAARDTSTCTWLTFCYSKECTATVNSPADGVLIELGAEKGRGWHNGHKNAI